MASALLDMPLVRINNEAERKEVAVARPPARHAVPLLRHPGVIFKATKTATCLPPPAAAAGGCARPLRPPRCGSWWLTPAPAAHRCSGRT